MSNKKDEIDELKKYEDEAERLKTAYHQCIGIISYLKNKKPKKEDK